jgi:predicted acetyltransferase
MQVRSRVRCDSVAVVVRSTHLPVGLIIRSADDADWPAMARLAAACFGSVRSPEANDMWRTMVAADGAIVVCDGPEIVGMSLYLDLRLTVPGGVILPAAGVTWVAVAPTHRRRGLLREMFEELHRRIVDARYPVAALLASEGGIYGRFGYGPATIEQRLRVERRWAQVHPDVPDPGGVRVVCPSQYRAELVDIYDRWRRRTPGGLHSPAVLWDDVLADRETARHGGSPFFALLHADGFAMYRVHGDATRKSVEVTKLTAVTAEAHIALWRVLLGLDLMDTITVDTHPADPLPYLLTDARRVQTTSSEDALWLRIIDIPATLEARSYQADLSAVLEISDDALGGGTFTLTIHNGKARVTPTKDTPDLHTDLSVLGSIYMGAHRASAFATANRLRCNDNYLLRQLDVAFATEVSAELGYGF